jgi:hypothetical protein
MIIGEQSGHCCIHVYYHEMINQRNAMPPHFHVSVYETPHDKSGEGMGGNPYLSWSTDYVVFA